MQGSADTLFIYTFFSGLPPEGLRSMPKITIVKKIGLFFRILRPKIYFSGIWRKSNFHNHFIQGPRFGTIGKNHIQSSSKKLRNCSFLRL